MTAFTDSVYRLSESEGWSQGRILREVLEFVESSGRSHELLGHLDMAARKDRESESIRRDRPKNIAAQLMLSDLHNDISGMEGPFLNGRDLPVVHVMLKNGYGISLCAHESDEDPEMTAIHKGANGEISHEHQKIDANDIERNRNYDDAHAALSLLATLDPKSI